MDLTDAIGTLVTLSVATAAAAEPEASPVSAKAEPQPRPVFEELFPASQTFPAGLVCETKCGRRFVLNAPVTGAELFAHLSAALKKDVLKFYVHPYNGYIYSIAEGQVWPEMAFPEKHDGHILKLVFGDWDRDGARM